jgi:hypothetical protein
MTGRREEQEPAKVKRLRKKHEHNAVESKAEMNADFQKQGMSHGWQGFYAQVRKVVME